MPRPNFRDLRLNWSRSDLSVAEKLRLTAKNNWIKLTTASNCCGNHGEPGC